MNMAQVTEFWSHYLEHFVSVLHCRVCACGSYGGGDIHEGGGGGTTQEVFSLPHQQNEVLEGWMQGTGSDLLPPSYHGPVPSHTHVHTCVCILPRPSTMQHTIAYTCTYLHTFTLSHSHTLTPS